MIDFNELKNQYETAVGYKLFMEEGEMEDFYRYQNTIVKPVCGTYRVNPITLTAIRTPFIGIATVNISMVAPPDRWEEVRDKMDAVASVLNGTSINLKDSEGTVYSVSYNCQTSAVGERILDVSLGCGEVFPIHQTISYIIIESGVSAYDAKLWIDGMSVPILSLVENKIHTTSMYSTSYGDGQTASEMEAYGIDFTSPYTQDDICKLFRDAVNEKTGNTAHCVVIEKNCVRSCRIMQFSHASNSVSPPQNIGFNISMTEIHPATADFDGFWSEKTVSTSFARIYLSSVLSLDPDVIGITIFWDDGKADDFDYMNGTAFHIYTDGKTSHTLRIYKRYESMLAPYRFSDRVDLCGNYITFKTNGEKVYASSVGNGSTKIWVNGENPGTDSYRAMCVSGGRFYQQVGSDLLPFGEDDENGNYISDGMKIQCVMNTVEALFTDFAESYIWVDRKDIYVPIPEG